jgi:hypothetical protein
MSTRKTSGSACGAEYDAMGSGGEPGRTENRNPLGASFHSVDVT